MDDLLTTKQLQDLLQVDRITIYRMLHDGRLRGFKVGGQWRFSRGEIDAWLRDQQMSSEALNLGSSSRSTEVPVQALPLSCFQAIQDVFAEVLDLAAVTTGLDGTPLTEISNSCDFCGLILTTDRGSRRCQAAWRQSRHGTAQLCHAGLHCISAPVTIEGGQSAAVSICQFSVASRLTSQAGWEAGILALTQELDLEREELLAAGSSIREVSQDALERASRLLLRVAETFSQIGQERLNFVSRLKDIAEMTKV